MKNIINRISISLVCVSSVIFLMTGQYSHQPTPPPFMGSVAEPFHHEGVHILAKQYTAEESLRYLHRNVYKSGVYPVQVTIQNNTKQSYLLLKEGVNIAQTDPHEIANQEYLKSLPRSLAIKVASLFFWPFLIPGTIDTIVTTKTYFSLKSDLYAKSIKQEGEMILPFSTVHRIIFVPPQDFQDGFIIYLQDSQNHHYTAFPVEIYS